MIETIDDVGARRGARAPGSPTTGGRRMDRGRECRAAVRRTTSARAGARARAPGVRRDMHGRDRAESRRATSASAGCSQTRYGWADCWIALVADTGRRSASASILRMSTTSSGTSPTARTCSRRRFAGRRGIVAAAGACRRGSRDGSSCSTSRRSCRWGRAWRTWSSTPGAEVLGVAYAITADDLAHVDLTEGVLIENYRRVAVQRRPARRRRSRLRGVHADVGSRDASLRPSERYMALLIEGAEATGCRPSTWRGSAPVRRWRIRPRRWVRGFIDRALKKEPR